MSADTSTTHLYTFNKEFSASIQLNIYVTGQN